MGRAAGGVLDHDAGRTRRRYVRNDAGWCEIETLFRLDHIEEDARAGRPERPVAETRSAVLLRRGSGPVLIGAEVDDTPKHLYARFGFRAIALTRSFSRAP